jgi:hypothetical protein
MLLPSMQIIRGEETHYETKKYRCVECEMTFQNLDQASEGVKLAVKAYQEKHELLTAEFIKTKRRELGIVSAEKLAVLLNGTVSPATLKRIESGNHVQDTSTNEALSTMLSELEQDQNYIAICDSSDFSMTITAKKPIKGYEDSHGSWASPFAGLYAELESKVTSVTKENSIYC